MDEQREIIAAIAKHLGVTPQDVDLNASLESDLGLGPLERADLFAELSTRFEVSFVPAEVDTIETVNDLAVMIEDLMLE